MDTTTDIQVQVPPGQPSETVTVNSDLTQETITVGGFRSLLFNRRTHSWDNGDWRVTPQAIDEMMLDAQIQAAVDIRRIAVTAQGWTLTPPVDPLKDPRQAEILAAAYDNYLNLNTSMNAVAFGLMSALAYGYGAAEQIYEQTTDPATHKLFYRTTDIKLKDIRDFVVYSDIYGNELGYLPTAVNIMPGTTATYQAGNGQIEDTQGKTWTLYDRRKLVINKHKPTSHHPLGASALRSVFSHYVFTEHLTPEHMNYLMHFGTPTVVGKTNEKATARVPTDAQGRPIAGAARVPATKDLADKLANLHNASYIAIEFGEEVDYLQVIGDAKAILEAYDLHDRYKTKGILYETLATEEGERMARAASETHKDILDLVVAWDKDNLESSFTRDAIYWFVYYNYGEEDARKYTPRFNLGRVEHLDVVSMITALANGTRYGLIQPSQFKALFEMLHLPPATDEDIDEYRKRLNALATTQAGEVTPPANNDQVDETPKEKKG